jgi:UDP-N-acetylglucosamine--N-acetylmuramyl-(pentapeptide) pyrophosphoryl-undecaprenol N-acetylglucosamine transferase
LVVGGSQGASSINSAVAELARSDGLEDIALLWSTGSSTWETYAQFDKPPMRIVKEFWDPVADAYAAADVVVARAGAMTTAEICAWGLPSILIPLPSAAANHQHRNARALADAEAAIHLPETELSATSLKAALVELLDDRSELARVSAAARARGRPEAARKIASEVLQLVS